MSRHSAQAPSIRRFKAGRSKSLSRRQSHPKTKARLRNLFSLSRKPAFYKYLQNLLVELCRCDTTGRPDARLLRDAEDSCFKSLERELRSLGLPGASLERRPINPAIGQHPYFSKPHFAKTFSAKETYAGRANLVLLAPGANGARRAGGVALNAHIDAVAPYFAPRVSRGIVHGRGACDDKGSVVSMVGALKLLAELAVSRGLALNQNLVAMFVIDEETGGNGSLSLALDRDLKRFYDSVIVGECTGLKIHPANRGAVWYQAVLRTGPSLSPFEMFAFVNEEMEKEGVAIRAESRHPLFPDRPVQTCHGILGPYGEHPSRICGEVRFEVNCGRPPSRATERLIGDCLAAGLSTYTGLYGDKTRTKDPATGKPLVRRHYSVERRGTRVRVVVFGAAGHMGAIRERDGAITKTAHLVRSLVASKPRIVALNGGPVTFELGREHRRRLTMEGGQGFVPTHSMEEIMDRLRAAAQRGLENYRRQCQGKAMNACVEVSFEKLHNEAYAGDPNSPAVREALAVAKICGLPQDRPLRGWTVSCDARLFAKAYPDMPVMTFGPGRMAFAHSDNEQIAVEEIRQAAEFLAVLLSRRLGILDSKL